MVQKIIKTEVQGIEAKEILNRFNNLEKSLQEIKEATTEQYPQNKLLTRKEVSDYLKISIMTVHNWTRNGILTAYRIGNKLRYKQSEIDTALNTINLKKA